MSALKCSARLQCFHGSVKGAYWGIVPHSAHIAMKVICDKAMVAASANFDVGHWRNISQSRIIG